MGVNLKVKLGKIKINSPIIMVSGTFGYGIENIDFINYKQVGAITTKTITFEKWKGNPQPRILEIPGGMINSIGLQNPGVDYFCKKIYPQLDNIKKSGTKIFVSITDRTLTQMLKILEKLNKLNIDAIELNLSCPNFEKGKLMISQMPEKAFLVVKEVKNKSKFPLIVKLSPNVTDITEIACAVEEGGADVLSLVNTLKGLAFDWKRGKIIEGGISGKCLKPVGLKCVYEVYKKVKIPIIGIGGITEGKDAVEYILAGANAVGIGSGFFSNPEIVKDVFEYIYNYLNENNFKSIEEITGLLNEKENQEKER